MVIKCWHDFSQVNIICVYYLCKVSLEGNKWINVTSQLNVLTFKLLYLLRYLPSLLLNLNKYFVKKNNNICPKYVTQYTCIKCWNWEMDIFILIEFIFQTWKCLLTNIIAGIYWVFCVKYIIYSPKSSELFTSTLGFVILFYPFNQRLFFNSHIHHIRIWYLLASGHIRLIDNHRDSYLISKQQIGPGCPIYTKLPIYSILVGP